MLYYYYFCGRIVCTTSSEGIPDDAKILTEVEYDIALLIKNHGVEATIRALSVALTIFE